MIIQFSALTFAASLLSSHSLVLALSASDIPSDIPISSLLSSANAHLANGKTNDALTYYDVAISRDPNNYLTYFKRGATYLSLGRTAQAQEDFDKVLSIKPGFEGALLQRAKIKSKNGEWDAAKKDYAAAGKASGIEIGELEEAQGAAALAVDAAQKENWEDCVAQAGVAIMVASRHLSLRQLRARCRFERGEVQEGISDLAHVLQMQPGLTDPYLQISSILFYSLMDTERGMAQIRKCLHSDPDSKSCKKLHRREKAIEKDLSKVNKFFEKKQYSSAVKLLVQSGEEQGLIQEVKDDVEELRKSGTLPAKAPNNMAAKVVEMACEAYSEVYPSSSFPGSNYLHILQMNSEKKAAHWCDEALSHNENSLHGLLSKAQRAMSAENYESCVQALNRAKEHHSGAPQIQPLLQKAEIALRRSKEKDYYKVLGVPSDADEVQIKAAYRKMTRQHHPDKAVRLGVSKEDAEKKMAAINEAYEVLSDPELRARFDRGDDPNSQERQGNPFQGSPFGGGRPVFFQQGGGEGHSHQFQWQGGFPFR